MGDITVNKAECFADLRIVDSGHQTADFGRLRDAGVYRLDEQRLGQAADAGCGSRFALKHAAHKQAQNVVKHGP